LNQIEISVVIPCYNEEKILPKSIKALERFFYIHRKNFLYELIFIDDGSTDSTLELLNSYAESGKNIRVLNYKYNVGKGHAVRRGLNHAKYNNILVLDADLSVRPDEVLSVFERYELDRPESFIVCGIRKYAVPQTKIRIFLGKAYSLLHKVLLNVGVWDSQCPLKLLHNISDEFVGELKIDGFAYDLELLYRAKKKGIHILPLVVSYHNEPDSRVTFFKVLEMFVDTIKIRFLK